MTSQIVDKIELTPEQWHAIMVAGKKAADHRDALTPGKAQPVDVMLRITGTLDVGSDSTFQRTVKPSPEMVLAAVLQEVSSWSSTKAHADPIGKIIAALKDRSEIVEGFAAMAKQAVTEISSRVPTTRVGSVSGRLQIGVVNMNALQPQARNQVFSASRLIDLDEEEEEEDQTA